MQAKNKKLIAGVIVLVVALAGIIVFAMWPSRVSNVTPPSTPTSVSTLQPTSTPPIQPLQKPPTINEPPTSNEAYLK